MEGARSLYSGSVSVGGPAWLTDWEEILVNESPGSSALFAFTCGDGVDSPALRRRVDALTAGLAELGILRGAPISLNIVVAFEQSPDAVFLKSAARLLPTAFFPGVRPHSFAVDLRKGAVVGGGRTALGTLLTSALAGASPSSADFAQVQRRQRENVTRTAQFYELMRGRQPVVTYSLTAANIAVFVIMLLSSGGDALAQVLRGGAVADATVRAWGAESPRLIEHGQWWRLCSEMFLHASLTHIVFNMASLLAIGTLAERLYGSRNFLVIYLGAGLIGSVVSFLYAAVEGNLNVLGVGASGAIFGVAGALLTVRYQRSDAIPSALRRRVSSSMAPLVLISLFIAAVTPYVDNSAHLGGLAGGMLLSFVFPLTKQIAPNA